MISKPRTLIAANLNGVTVPAYILYISYNNAPSKDIVTTTAFEKQFVVVCGDTKLLYLSFCSLFL